MKEIKIQIPDGYEGIDEEKSNLAEGVIVFKKKGATPWSESNPKITGFYVTSFSNIKEQSTPIPFDHDNKNVFATEKQAKSMLAMAQLSQIIQNDERFGGPITDEEWNNPRIYKYVIFRQGDKVTIDWWNSFYHFLAFHTREQRELFMKDNMDLIRQYYMLDD